MSLLSLVFGTNFNELTHFGFILVNSSHFLLPVMVQIVFNLIHHIIRNYYYIMLRSAAKCDLIKIIVCGDFLSYCNTRDGINGFVSDAKKTYCILDLKLLLVQYIHSSTLC